jgi:hypothetical protein
MNKSLDSFGAFSVRHLRDSMLDELETFLDGGCKADNVQELQNWLTGLGTNDKRMIRDLIEKISTTGMHDFLFALQEQADNGGDIRLLVNGEEIAKQSDGMHGELFGEKGWIVRHSRHHSQQQIDLSRWAEAETSKIIGDPQA